MNNTLILIRPDDWHVHLRDGDALHTVVPHTARQFARAVVMLQTLISSSHLHGMD